MDSKWTILTSYLLTRWSQTHNYSPHLLELIKMHSQPAKKRKLYNHSLCSLWEVMAISRRTDTLTTRASCTWPVEWRSQPLVAVLSTGSARKLSNITSTLHLEPASQCTSTNTLLGQTNIAVSLLSVTDTLQTQLVHTKSSSLVLQPTKYMWRFFCTFVYPYFCPITGEGVTQ